MLILNEMKFPMTKNKDGIYEELYHICKISSNFDESISKIVADSL